MKTFITTKIWQKTVHLVMTLLFLLFTSFTASATDFITDVMLIGHNGENDINALKETYRAQGWTVYPVDLNANAGGDWIYLLYKTKSSPNNFNDGTFITDFYIKSGANNVTSELPFNGLTYHLVPYDGYQHFKDQQGDLNSGTGENSASIHLYYTKEFFSDFHAITGFSFDSEKSGALGANGNNTNGYDLNDGCKSSAHKIYMHITTATAPPFSGAGTANDPYHIGTTADWDRLAGFVSKGQFADKCYQLTENITASSMVGTAEHPFCGTFNGQDKTLTLNISSSEAYVAPFRYVNGATIKNLTVNGSCTGGIHTSGLVGNCAGTVSINHCTVAANVTTSASHVGGFVGHGGTSSLTIASCVFSGTISGFTGAAGGILGWCDAMTLTMNNCLFKGSFSPGTGGKYHPIGCCNPEKTVNATFTSVYYLNSITPTAYFFGGADTPVSSTNVEGVWNDPVTAADGIRYYGKIKKKTIPYAYGFEDGNPFADGWKLVNGILSTEILHDADASYEGNYCFKFSNDGTTTQYFISPELDCSTALSMTFYQYGLGAPRFKVGYCMATSPDDLSYFKWGDEITGTNESWFSVTRTLPKGTRFVAIQILPVGAGNILFVDNFRFEACSYPAPTDLTLSALTDKTATLEWSAPNADINISSYKWQYKKDGESSWSDEVSTTDGSVNLNDLSGYTTYNFQVKAVYSDREESMWQSISFRTSMSLPYECGFENVGDLDKWTMTDVYDFTRVYDVRSEVGADLMYACPYNGQRNFCFCSFNENKHPQYLISPQFNGEVPIQVSFYYRNKQADVWDTFEVGVSYSDNNISSFSWGPEIGAENGEWRQYDNTFIGGDVKPRYIAIKYTGNREALFVDDVIFSEASSSTKPTNLTVSSVTNQSATLTWTAPTGATGYAYRYKLATGNSWSEGTVTSASVTLTGLSASTSYDFRVKALYASAPASNETEIRFLTEGNAQALPYYESFYEKEMGGWRLVNGDGDSKIEIDPQNEINNYFWFAPYFDHQYLISPELASDKPILVSFFYKEDVLKSGQKSIFQVGWSSSTKDVSSFEWGAEIEATSVMQNYIIQVPQGTRYVAIKKIKEGNALCLDDFGFIDSEQYVLSTTPVHAFGEDCFVTTFYHLNYPFQLPEGSRAYTAKLDGEVVFQLIGDDGRIIPNDTPCIIVSDRLPSDPKDATKDIVLKPLSSTDVRAHDGNILRGSYVSIIPANEMVEGRHVYVVDVYNGELGFYRFVGDEIPPQKVFILQQP
jgi:hypothetical protein